jgi:hypothetical protein
LNQHPFHIIYKDSLPVHVKAAVDNVFDNFYYFLNFNSFSFTATTFSIGLDGESDFILSSTFLENINSHIFMHEKWFDKEALVIEKQNKDYLASCFYLINSLQEYASYELDVLGRFQFKSSYQYKFSCTEDQIVLKYFQEIALKIFKRKIPLLPSKYLLSHDIDFLNNGWKGEIKKALLQLKLIEAIKIVIKKIKGKDPNQNIEEIILAEKKLNVPSLFFFLVKKGKTKFSQINNSDYSLSSKYVQRVIKLIKQSPLHSLGLHKSIGSSSLEDELKMLKSKHNRFHYLNFNVPKDFEKLSKSNIQFDHSLGFSERIGFRNSYGLPYKPFNPFTFQYYNFWEIPLLIMDSSLHYFMGKEGDEEKLKTVQNFIDKNAETTVLSILWHNNFYAAESYPKLIRMIAEERDSLELK